VFDGIDIDLVRYREPIGTENSGPSPLLYVVFSNCMDRGKILSQYAPLSISQAPRGHSVDEETVYSQDRSWGTLSFGFAESAPNCLRTVTFAAR
jgi:hypothetical protein